MENKTKTKTTAVSIKTVKASAYFLSKATQHGSLILSSPLSYPFKRKKRKRLIRMGKKKKDFVCKEILKSETLLQFFDVYSHTSITFNDNFLATSYHCGKILKNLKAYCAKNGLLNLSLLFFASLYLRVFSSDRH